MPALSKVKLQEKDNTTNVVEFDFNPDSLTIERNGYHGLFDSGDEAPNQLVDRPWRHTSANPTHLVLPEVVFRGQSTMSKVQRLRDWAEPVWSRQRTSPPPEGQNQPSTTWQLPTLRFTWGSRGLACDVELYSLGVTLTRFTSDGFPVAAKATVKLHVLGLNLTATNPTSGGLPGRQSTTIVQGQNLQSVALDRYGASGRWRELADANGIEDPLRVRPGTVLYLPGRDELPGGVR